MTVGLLATLSVRNLLRHRRRNAMLVAAIVVAVAGVTFMNSFIRGFQQDLRDSAVANLTGHIKVHAPGYRDDPSIERSFEVAASWQPDIDAQALQGWAARVRVPAVIMSERETRGVQLVGIDPAQEGISFLGDVDFDGEQLSGVGDKRVFLGAALLDQLDTRVGRRLVLITQGSDGRNREAGFRIAGVYDAEGTALEKAYVFTGREALQKLLDTQAVTEVSIRLLQDPTGPSIQRRLLSYFTGLEVLGWRELEPQVAAMFVFADTAIFIWFSIMMGALVFGLVNSLITAVMERVREFGMLRAVGMRPGAVMVQVVMESTVLMAAGVAIGLGLGWLLCASLADGLDLSQWASGVEMVGMRSLVVPRLYGEDMLLVAVLSLVLGVVASLYPAWRAVKINPLEAMRR